MTCISNIDLRKNIYFGPILFLIYINDAFAWASRVEKEIICRCYKMIQDYKEKKTDQYYQMTCVNYVSSLRTGR